MTSTHLWLPLQDPAAGTHVCKENTIAERNVSDLSFVYLLFKSWTDRVTHLGSLENTLGSLLTSKATPRAAENIIIIEFGVWSKQSHILIAIQNLDMGTTNILIALIYRLFNKGKEGICPPHGSFIAKREEDMHAHSRYFPRWRKLVAKVQGTREIRYFPRLTLLLPLSYQTTAPTFHSKVLELL